MQFPPEIERKYLLLTNLKKLNIMKNLLKKALYLSVFAIAGVLFQISCSNDEASKSSLAANKLIYTRQSSGNQPQIWISDYDGLNQVQIPITFPSNVEISTLNNNGSSLKISPDGQKIFFVGFNTGTNLSSVYSCDVNGNNLQQIIAPSTFEVIELGGVN